MLVMMHLMMLVMMRGRRFGTGRTLAHRRHAGGRRWRGLHRRALREDRRRQRSGEQRCSQQGNSTLHILLLLGSLTAIFGPSDLRLSHRHATSTNKRK